MSYDDEGFDDDYAGRDALNGGNDKEIAMAEAADEEIELKLFSEGIGEIMVNRADYDEAKTAGELDEFLDVALSNLGHEVRVVDPEGNVFDPYSWDGEGYPRAPRPSSSAPTAIEELVEAIRLTVEYVGTDTLPAASGWSWYDALVKYAPEVAAGLNAPEATT